MYGLLTKCEVKMAGYWPSSFFACLWTETKSRSMNSQKNERGQYPAFLTEQTWSIKDLLYGFWWNFACGMQRVVPSGQDRSILPARVANHSARFGSSRRASHIINCFIIWLAPWAGKMNEFARCDWLPERARWSDLARSGLPAESRMQNFPKSHIINPLLTKFVRSRWLDIGLVLFFRVYGPRLRLGP